MMNLRDKEALYDTKEEDYAINTSTTASSSSRQWPSRPSGLKNPRIVRVSRTFGGKDRHSKVSTIKGLRDRRIRVSVPTAIQLYDLQDRLGLGQPSKVIDWLLDITKHDIDKLPPLPAIPGSFAHPFQQGLLTNSREYGMPSFIDHPNLMSSSRSQSLLDVDEDPSIVSKLKHWDPNSTIMRSKQKEIDDDDQGAIRERDHRSGNSQVLAQNFFPIASDGSSNASVPPPSTFPSNHPMYSYYHWEHASNLSLGQLGNLGLSSPNDHHQQHSHSSNNSSSLPSPLALSSGSSSQLFLSPSMASTSSIYPPHASYLSTHHPRLENDIRQFNRSHFSSDSPYYTPPLYTTNTSSGLGLKPFPFSMSHHPHLLPSEDDHDHRHGKNNIDDGSWKDSSRE